MEDTCRYVQFGATLWCSCEDVVVFRKPSKMEGKIKKKDFVVFSFVLTQEVLLCVDGKSYNQRMGSTYSSFNFYYS